MNRKDTIQSVLTFLMLIFFTISVSPKRYLHDIFAKHSESSVRTSNEGTAQLSESGFNCDCDNLVATSPFLDDTYSIDVSHQIIYPTLFVFVSNPLYSWTYDFTESRGPPSLG